MTLDDPKGLSCYLAADISFYSIAPLYGNRLQNRVWNLQDDLSKAPDAYLFNYETTENLSFVKKKILLDEVILSQGYEIVLNAPNTILFLKKEIVHDPQKQKRLSLFYADYFSDIIDRLKDIREVIQKDIPFLTSSLHEGHALKFLELNGDIPNSVYLVPNRTNPITAYQYLKQNGLKEFYTFHRPFNHAESRLVYTKESPGAKTVSLYFNRLARHE